MHPTSAGIRLAHLSDVHINHPRPDWRWRDWFNKRATGLYNARLGRGRRFRQAETVLAALIDQLRDERRPDRIVFSGDAGTLGFPGEIQRAADLMHVHTNLPQGLAVPGNHDYYTPEAAASGAFEESFRPWQTGERVDAAAYPFAQRVGPVWLVGVNSCTANRWPNDASGSVGLAQLDRLRRLLNSLSPGPRILVTHYPVAGADGRPEDRKHRLRDLAALLRTADDGGIGLWLHGHRHDPYFLTDPKLAPFPVVCAGSATQAGRRVYNEYTIEGLELRAVRRTFDAEHGRFVDGVRFALQLRGG
jgi:3',5'-cyclic AMP phosphodiesterase CpdA